MTSASRVDAVVIGSGFAGLSAAVRLADAGRTVIVVEQAPRLGGRASAFLDRETGARVDNGQHALFGCYRETYAFLARIGSAHLAPLQARLSLTMADGEGRRATLTCPKLPAPWHLAAGLMRWPALGLADRASALRLAGLLVRMRRLGARVVAEEVPATQTVSQWLAAHGQSRALCDWLWHPLALAALNQSPDIAAASPFVRVLGELFARNPAAASIGLPVVPLDELYGPPATAFLRARGGDVWMNAPASVRLDASGRVCGVRAGDRTVDAAVVISAVPWHAFDRIWDASPPAGLSAIASRAASMQGAPIVTVHLWGDSLVGNAVDVPSIGLVGGPMHWVFNHAAIGARGATHLSVVASGAEDLVRMENDEITAAAVAQLGRAVPELRAHAFRHAVVVRERRATFSLAPGAPPRPGAMTRLRGFFIAGDWTDTGLPGTIESAVQSGNTAASAALTALQ